MTHFLISIEFVSMVLALIVIFLLLDMIKRTRGEFCTICKIWIFAAVLFVFGKVFHILEDINYLQMENFESFIVVIEFIFVVVIFTGLYRLRFTVKKTHNGRAKKSG